MVCGPLFVLLSWALQMLGASMLKAIPADCLLEMNSNVFQRRAYLKLV